MSPMQTETEVRYHVAVKFEGQREVALFGACASRKLALERADLIRRTPLVRGPRIERAAIVMRLRYPGSSTLRFMVEDYSGDTWNLGRARWKDFSAGPWCATKAAEQTA